MKDDAFRLTLVFLLVGLLLVSGACLHMLVKIEGMVWSETHLRIR
jgi:hypothetical protein